ncbi:hypothetical protein FGO68_gene1962 [Halteria grandinella]|uniref:Uncharacterized protein n=1 Tax=Halteria grandinella TaxID=5974 RepID=A0A8J8N9J2_HALGN|nr:hypothetical protein FGO68_gene1962 [Halteria grandinella]
MKAVCWCGPPSSAFSSSARRVQRTLFFLVADWGRSSLEAVASLGILENLSIFKQFEQFKFSRYQQAPQTTCTYTDRSRPQACSTPQILDMVSQQT